MLRRNQQFAGVSELNRCERCRINNFDLFAGHDAPHTFGWIVNFNRAHGNPAAGFGGSVSLKNFSAELLLPAFADFNRQQITGTEPVLHRAQIILIDAVMLQNHAIQGGHSDHGFGFKALNGVQGRIQVNLRLKNQGAAHQKGCQAAGLSQDVKQGRISQNHIFFRCK